MQQSYFEQGQGAKGIEFSDLVVIQQDMKNIFRKIQRQDTQFKHAVE